LRISDVADVRRGFNDPPAPRMRFMGQDAIGLAVAMKDGGDILVLGKALEVEFERLQKQPSGGHETGQGVGSARCGENQRR
jgi:multidrug efflux pump